MLTLILSYKFISTALVIILIVFGFAYLSKGANDAEITIVLPDELLNAEDDRIETMTGEITTIPESINSIDDIKKTFEHYK